jgi:thiol-disulfide isomerase/thioredoxin
MAAAFFTQVATFRGLSARRIFLFAILLWAGLAQPLAAQEKPDLRVYFFTMSACPPCAQAGPVVDKFLAAGYPIQKIDARLQPQWVQQFQVSSTPTYVMTIAGKEVGRYSGVLSTEQLQNWFQRGVQAAEKATPSALASESPFGSAVATLTTQPDRGESLPVSTTASSPVGDTMHVGTRQPANEAEKLAMAATVRIQVEDAEGISTATGTVIHSHGGESLVMTCGHVFREAQGRGVITADVNWLTDQPTRVSGELINYDAGALDVALVLIRPGFQLAAVPLAPSRQVVDSEQEIFSIGCDRNAPPTIRRSRIKDIGVYDGARKYDIYGRPVLGRSGGGLFTVDGTLIGVCNAAAVEFDEGIYSAIDNLHVPIQKANLAHLFAPGGATTLASATPRGPATDVELSPSGSSMVPLSAPNRGAAPQPIPAVTGGLRTVQNVVPIGSSTSDWEAIVILRQRGSTAAAETMVISQPSDEFLNYVRGSWSPRPETKPAPSSAEAALQMAQMREEMPQPPMPDQPVREARAQSPR